MKKIILTIVISAITVTVFGQIKVFNGGNISLGSTTAPPSGFKLQVLGNSVFSETTGSITSSAYIRGINAYSTDTTPDYTWWGNDQTGMFHPANNTLAFTTNGTERMRFFSDGKVTIGHTENWGSQLMINTGNSIALATYVNHTSDYGYAQVSYVNREYSKALAVIYNSNQVFNVYGNGEVWASTSFTTSDQTLKENILPVENALAKILQLNGVTYNYIRKGLQPGAIANTTISSTPPRRELGLIAQDVEAIVPEVVETNDIGVKGIAYSNLVSLLIEGMKEQNEKITQLEQDLNNCCSKKNSERGMNGSTENNTETGDVNSKNNLPQLGGTDNSAQLYQNKPNPFNNQTIIEYFIPTSSIQSSILVFDMQGKLMKTIVLEQKEKGNVQIDANSLYPGMYLYSLVVDNKEIDTKRMIITQ